MIINQSGLLRLNIYEYLYEELRNGRLNHEKAISLNKLSSELGISKTPLRDALLELQAEGFVTLYPQRGVFINQLTCEQKTEIYEVCSILDAKVIQEVFHKVTDSEIQELKKINRLMDPNSGELTCEKYNKYNVDFHEIYLALSNNNFLKKIIRTSRIRLFQFTNRNWGEEFSRVNYFEHLKIIELFEHGNPDELSDYIQNTHWSFNW